MRFLSQLISLKEKFKYCYNLDFNNVVNIIVYRLVERQKKLVFYLAKIYFLQEILYSSCSL